MLQLSPALQIGKGRDRACYQHPDEPSKCIKVSIVSNDKQSRREPRYYQHLANRNISWDNIARFYGKLKTNMGNGLVYELVRDANGPISRSLNQYLADKLLTQQELELLLLDLKGHLYRDRILARDISPNNLLLRVQDDDTKQLVIIDGLGNSELIPVSSYIGYFSDRFITKKWRRLLYRIQLDFPDYRISSHL